MRLTQEQIEQFREHGYLAAEGIVTDADLAPVIRDIEVWIDDKARELKAQGEIADSYEGESFEKRLALLHEQSPKITAGMDIMYMRSAAFFEFFHNRNLLDAVEGLVGPEISCNPIQHLRGKVPTPTQGVSFFNVPWHQDLAVTTEDANDSNIVTCWLALVDATVENGCMEVIPDVFKTGILLPHGNSAGGGEIKAEALPDITPVPVPVKRGGMVFMHRLTPHRSTPNYTDAVRWSLDMRFHPTGQPSGRSAYPEFVVRSASDPDSVFQDRQQWAELWKEAMTKPSAIVHRVM
jgi:phytanoyl-CoA hydroxylase